MHPRECWRTQRIERIPIIPPLKAIATKKLPNFDHSAVLGVLHLDLIASLMAISPAISLLYI